MKPPIETVRVSARGREALIKIKKNTGIEHWNEMCRLAFCLSLADSTIPQKTEKTGDRSIDMEWKKFAGQFQEEFAYLIILRAKKDGVDFSKKEPLAEYLRAHIERGIANIQNVKKITSFYEILASSTS